MKEIEFISKIYEQNNTNLKDVVIDVCGLVTNICVVHTCIGGYKYFKLENSDNIPKFQILNEYCLPLYTKNYNKSEVQVLKNTGFHYFGHKLHKSYFRSRFYVICNDAFCGLLHLC